MQVYFVQQYVMQFVPMFSRHNIMGYNNNCATETTYNKVVVHDLLLKFTVYNVPVQIDRRHC